MFAQSGARAMETCTLAVVANLPNLLVFSQDCRLFTLSVDTAETPRRTLFFMVSYKETKKRC